VRGVRTLTRLAIAAPASIPGVYAWGVTVAPVVWGRAGVSRVAEVAAVAGPVFLGAGAGLEGRFGSRSRSTCLWGFTMLCAVAWVSAAGLGDPLLDATHTRVGIFAWAVFALSWASPPLKASGDTPRVVVAIPKVVDSWPRAAVANMACGVCLAVGLQLVSFEAKSPELALLVRLVAVGGGLLAIAAFTKAALARFRRRKAPSSA
jgi:hypothetical protein